MTVNLLADGEQVDSKEVTANEDWMYAFTNLPKFKDGKEIVYTVTENQVPDYNTEITGYDITNTYTPTTPGKPATPGKSEKNYHKQVKKIPLG
ncbi:hypothetical protein CUR52_15975 [Enterococcus faecalis]|nr:hypothetical protein CUR52_15975 [Enterococcus faecalis]